MNNFFRNLAQKASTSVGSPWAFVAALLLILGWLALGTIFDYSDTWQLIINTMTTIVTFLMVFLIQNTQNRDAKVFHLKLDELLRAVEPARNSFVDLEDLSDEELKQVQEEFRILHEKYGDAVSPLHRALHQDTARVAGKRAKKRRGKRTQN
jgi:low affinity Fe/Cu permease